MANVKSILVVMVVSLGVIAGPQQASAAAAKCVFQKSCAKRFFRCFRTQGSCQTQAGTGVTTACWDNGAKVTQESGTGGTIAVLGRNAKPCVVGTEGRGPNGEFQVSWTRKKNRTLVFTANPDGTRSFTCPSGKVETYSRTDFTNGLVCGHIPTTSGGAASACAVGTCQ